ncbi:UDP-N-acetylmuramoyl-L-alanine--D-glutamate ligase [Bacteroidetes bacterium endosymbiont of Geopemphigus sp.]|uniref:UDP-N-acetylmuramoyl-L-alanine--D-glutamate ligase n=1 Tax=Bacteroidetes bacterium endosymbiont of Geopemphigus sp. TaxID=2047937 RepID=UPI000CD2C220|nr:UDP-N-acetylmuramoyl-L-alanine--D-glutamate ligase [Bacteroidetes bacterium endosymbiont of Geopemphigus sp.]
MIKKLVILGGGESGTGAALLAKKQGFSVFLSDASLIKDKYKKNLIQQGIAFEEGHYDESLILSAHEIIKSPGIPDSSPMMKKIYKKNLPVISEIEFAWRYNRARIIAITGSNGKTTTSLLTYHLLKKGGLNVALAGNIGKSFARQVAEKNPDCYVLEVSSFQLDNSPYFRTDIAILLNITPDHLDRYHYKMEKYAHSKFQICAKQTAKDFFIYNHDDPILRAQLTKSVPHSKMLPFSIKETADMAAWLENQIIHIDSQKEYLHMAINELNIKGYHNVYNTMAAGLAASVEKVRKESIKKSLASFEAVEHRLEKVLKIQDIWFINDSKATNVNAVFYALESMKAPVIWIAGGQDKGNDYSELPALVKKKVKALICLGLDNGKLIKSFHKLIDPIVEVKSMQEAVKAAYMLGRKGDVVLLSPACASFDLFENYEDRGRRFKEEVKKL